MSFVNGKRDTRVFMCVISLRARDTAAVPFGQPVPLYVILFIVTDDAGGGTLLIVAGAAVTQLMRTGTSALVSRIFNQE